MVDNSRDNPDSPPSDEHHDDRPVDDSDALMPVETEPATAPPVDVDDREGGSHSDQSIAMPEASREASDGDSVESSEEVSEADVPRRAGWNDTIDDLVPLPQDEPHHTDDADDEDPFDAQDQVDIHVPPSTGDATGETDDFSTGEELDVDNAPGGHNPEHEQEASASPESTETFSATTFAAEDDGIAPPFDPASGQAENSTTCPTCGRQTDALRFCGHCGGPLTESRHEITGDTSIQRLMSRAEGYMEPLAHWTRPGGVRAILALGAALVLISLLANSSGMALIIGASILPAVILYWCRRADIFENEPWYIVTGFATLGAVAGALLGWLGAITTTGTWFDEGVLNYGAAGFGGRFAEAAGNAPFMVWLVCGIIVPVAALAAIIAGPLLMRQTMSLRNEVMDGLTLAAAMGGGFAIGSAVVFVAPMFDQPGPAITASGWTLTTIGITILRPLIWTLGGGMIGAAAWRYMLSGKLNTAIVPAAAGVAIPLFATMLAIQLSTTGLWAEIVLGVVAAVAAAIFYQRTLADAVREDRRVLGGNNERIVCPNCQRVTPAGQFCAHCGENLVTAA